MPYRTIGRAVTRGTICKDRWRAAVTVMCADRLPAGAAASLFLDIQWRRRREGTEVPGRPEDAQPTVLRLRKRTDAASGDIRFDGPDGPTQKGFPGDARELLTLYGRAATAGGEADVLLEVSIDGEVRGSIPLAVGAPATSLDVRAGSGTAPAPDYVLQGQRVTLRGVPTPPAAGTYRWLSVGPEALEVLGDAQAESVEVAARQVSAVVGDRPLCLLFTPAAGPAAMAVHRMTVARARILLHATGDTPAPDLLGRGRTETFRAELTPAGLTTGVSWGITAGGTLARIVGAADAATVDVEGLAVSAAAGDIELTATFRSDRNPAALPVTHGLTVTGITVQQRAGVAAPRFFELGRPVELRAVVAPDPLPRDAFWLATPDAGSSARAVVQPIAGVALVREAAVTGTATSTPHTHDDIALLAGLRTRDGTPVGSTAVEHRFTVTMDRPLRLFIAPPYMPPAPAPPVWSLVYGYGPTVPGPGFRSHAMVSTAGPGILLGAADGTLSVRAPASGGLDPAEEFVPPAPGEPLPGSVNLYLHLSPLVANEPTFRARARELNRIRGFAYLNVETASLEAGLAELLDHVALPPGAVAPTRADKVDLLVRGQVTVSVTAGHAIGAASTEGAALGSRRVGFTVLTDNGPLDPAHGYDWMRDFVADGQPDVDRFLELVPKRWPVIDPGLSAADAIDLTRHALYAMPVLEELRRSRALTAAQRRQVGNNQKALWRARLLRRVGHAPAGSSDPPFEFDDEDWQNVFQLEALAELYVNYNDPWRPPPLIAGENQPRSPVLADGVTPNPAHITVDLLTGWHLVVVDSFGGRMGGAAATAAGNVVTLDGAPDLSRVNGTFDTIYLPSDRARPSRTYRITAANDAAHTVTVDGVPDLDGGTSAWHLPAGVSGELPPMAYNLGPGGARGYDHFDGVMFIVKDGQVHGKYRWSSYTSRDYPAGSQLLSSLRGNKRYDFSSFRSANAFRNYSFKVNDPGAAYDGVREARFYFSTPVTPDVAPPGVNPNGGGKTLIRIHHSVTNAPGGGCSSAGCIVSGNFYTFRDQMIDLYQADYAAGHGGAIDANIDRIHGRGHAASQNLWNGIGGPTVTAAQWNNHLRGALWVIRPDERPL